MHIMCKGMCLEKGVTLKYSNYDLDYTCFYCWLFDLNWEHHSCILGFSSTLPLGLGYLSWGVTHYTIIHMVFHQSYHVSWSLRMRYPKFKFHARSCIFLMHYYSWQLASTIHPYRVYGHSPLHAQSYTFQNLGNL